ncbi:MAG: hypothetical protein ACSHWQ_02005, partial [Spongiibacteraceae bacterium]
MASSCLLNRALPFCLFLSACSSSPTVTDSEPSTSRDAYVTATSQPTEAQSSPSIAGTSSALFPVMPAPSKTPDLIVDPISEFYADVPSCGGTAFDLRDLIVDEVRVSNNDLQSIASTLTLMGYNVLDLQSPMPLPSAFSCEQLPLVVIPQLSSGANSSIGSMNGQGGGDQYGSNATHITPLGNSDASELDRFLAYYHPSQEQAFKKLKWLVAKRLDVASAQVYIETMVLEVREEDSQEFGLEYSKADGDKFITLGGLVPGSDTIDFLRDTLRNPFSDSNIYQPGFGKRLKLKALIDEGKAEVVSR